VTAAHVTAAPAPDEPRPVAQRALLVLPSTGAFDSRAYRIASLLAGRGHDVTVLARAGEGLPDDERRPEGYRILRVPVSARDGLPGPIRRLASRGGPATPPAATGDAAAQEPTAPAAPPATSPVVRVRRGFAAVRRLAAIGLTVRSQRIRTQAVAPDADLVHAMAYMGIPVGLAVGRGRVPVLYDARDIYVDAANLARLPGFARRLFGRIERSWARRAARVVTVNEPYARVMAGRWDVPMPLIVLNCAWRRQPPSERPDRIRAALGLAPERRIVLYHGGFSRDRGIEQLIDGLSLLPADVDLVLLGYGVLEATLRARAADPALGGRLHVLPAVPPTELIDWVASADIVAMPIQPTTLNHRLTTPNKLFEAMAAGVPVVASDLPGMSGIVRESGCGTLVDPTDPTAIATAIRALLDLPEADRAAIGRRGLEAHLETYNWDAQSARLLAEYGRLTGRPW